MTINTAGLIADANAAAERMTGVPRERLIGSDFASYFTEPNKARGVRRRALDNGQALDALLGLRHVSGTVTPVLDNATLYNGPNGDVAGVLAVARDVSRFPSQAQISRVRGPLLSAIIAVGAMLLVFVGVSAMTVMISAFVHERQTQADIVRTMATKLRMQTLLWEISPPPARALAATMQYGTTDGAQSLTIAYGIAEPGHVLNVVGREIAVSVFSNELPAPTRGICVHYERAKFSAINLSDGTFRVRFRARNRADCWVCCW